jgi:hypothetical protein
MASTVAWLLIGIAVAIGIGLAVAVVLFVLSAVWLAK